MASTGFSNGHANAYGNGHDTNGYANGHTNGYTNGHENGHANGGSNDHANSHVNDHVNGTNGTNGTNDHINGRLANGKVNGGGSSRNGHRSRLPPANPDAVQDLLCVGFGPASLAIAVALHDALEAGTIASPPKVLFLEKQKQFAWHAGMLLPGAKMQISFLKDMATLRNPRSAYTFVNYLHSHDRLVEFINLSTFLPARVEYEDYLRWCARSFDDSVIYGSEVLSVEVEKGEEADKAATTFRVVSQNTKTGNTSVYRARNVILATGGKPSIPRCLPAGHPRVLHSSQFAQLAPTILSNSHAPYRVAVVGAGQSAAEIFNNIQMLYPNSQTYLIMRSEFLRPSDDSPFVNSIFDPGFVDRLYSRPVHERQSLLADARSTNYGVVRLELIEALHERMYHQRRSFGSDERQWPHRLMGSRHIAKVEVLGHDDSNSSGGKDVNGHSNNDRLRISLIPTDQAQAASAVTEELEVDLIVAATGYQRNAHVDMLQGLWPLLPHKASAAEDALLQRDASGSWEVEVAEETAKEDSGGASTNTSTRLLTVSRDYHVEFMPGTVAPGSGVWLQGCCEATHGLSDTLLSVLATRSGEIVESLFGSARHE